MSSHKSKAGAHGHSSPHELNKLKRKIKHYITLGIMGTFLFLFITTAFVINNQPVTTSSQAGFIDDRTKELLERFAPDTECITDSQCQPGYVCRNDPIQGNKQCFVCQQLSCPAPVRTVKYGKLCLDRTCSQYRTYASPSCNDGTLQGFDEQIQAWCRQSDIEIVFTVTLNNTQIGDVQFVRNGDPSRLVLTRYDTRQNPWSDVSVQTLDVDTNHLLNTGPKTEFRFTTVMNANDIESGRNAYKLWLELPSYTTSDGEYIDSAWISSPETITIEENTPIRSYNILLEI